MLNAAPAADATLDSMPGFRRRIRITPTAHCVRVDLEDDYHCMSVTIHHRDGVAASIEPIIERAPWSTCPGAVEQLKHTFAGVALGEFAERGAKRENCTHLHDLATLGAAHAFDTAPLTYDVLVSDPVRGQREAELRRNGSTLLRLVLIDGKVTEPAECAGATLDKLSAWIGSLEPHLQEGARVLRWGAMLANGRTIPLERQADASRMPVGNCYTFQPNTRDKAVRVGAIRDFSKGKAQPLDERVALP